MPGNERPRPGQGAGRRRPFLRQFLGARPLDDVLDVDDPLRPSLRPHRRPRPRVKYNTSIRPTQEAGLTRAGRVPAFRVYHGRPEAVAERQRGRSAPETTSRAPVGPRPRRRSSGRACGRRRRGPPTRPCPRRRRRARARPARAFSAASRPSRRACTWRPRNSARNVASGRLAWAATSASSGSTSASSAQPSASQERTTGRPARIVRSSPFAPRARLILETRIFVVVRRSSGLARGKWHHD